ncbi:hypothetical protein Tco_0257212 [Tanacetum coccineum]
MYGKPILITLVTNDIQNSEAYKTFIGISTGLIPPKKRRCKGAQGTKAIVVLKKTTATSKKKQSKRKLVLHDESDKSEGEPKIGQLAERKGHPELLSFKNLQGSLAIKASKCESRFQHQTGGSSKGAGLGPEVFDEPTWKSAISDKGAGTSPEVLDEIEDTNDDEEDESDDDKSIDIKKSDDERMDTDVEDQDDEELKADKEQKGDDQAVDAVILVSTTQKGTPNLLQSTSSHSVSSNFSNQFINSPNASLIVKSVVQRFTELERAVKELKQAEHSTTILASIRSQVPSVVKEYLGSSLPDSFQKVLQSHTEELKKELSEKRNYKDIIEDSVQDNVINEVKNFLPKFLPQALKEALEKTLLSFGQSSSQGQSTIEAAEFLSKYELKKILYAKMHKTTTKECDNPNKVLKKRDRGDDQDEDPSAGSNQGKKTKKRIFNESESSKKTSTTKESSIGKSPAKMSKSRKSVTTKESVEEPVFETASDDVEQTIDDKVGDVGQPPHTDADET